MFACANYHSQQQHVHLMSMLVSTIANWSQLSVKYGFFAKSFFQKARNSIKRSFSIRCLLQFTGRFEFSESQQLHRFRMQIVSKWSNSAIRIRTNKDNAMFACANYHSQQQHVHLMSMLVSTIANWSQLSVKYGFFAKSFFQKARNSIKRSFSIRCLLQFTGRFEFSESQQLHRFRMQIVSKWSNSAIRIRTNKDNAIFACTNYHSQQPTRNSKGSFICSPYILSMLVSTIANWSLASFL